jgi:plasmid stabilization system protein ParE
MCAHKPTIRLTAQAERGIEDILLYTERTWGFDQSEPYAMVITQARELLRDHSQFGRQHDGLG